MRARDRRSRRASPDHRVIVEALDAVKRIVDEDTRRATVSELLVQLDGLEAPDQAPMNERLSIWEPGDIEMPAADDFHRLAGTRRT